jgi:hypothetical protein
MLADALASGSSGRMPSHAEVKKAVAAIRNTIGVHVELILP